VVADTVYGHSPDLRLFLQKQGYAYALAVPSPSKWCVCRRVQAFCSVMWPASHAGATCLRLAAPLAELGTKGERLFDWARLPVVHAGAVDGRHWLVVRRCLGQPRRVGLLPRLAPPETPLSTMVQAIGARWRIEVRRVGAYGIPV